MARLEFESPEGVHLRFEIAGVGSRAVAGLIDLLLIVFVWVSVLLAMILIAQVDPTGVSGFAAGLGIGGLIMGLVLYQWVVAALWNGQTPGKRALGLRVVDAAGYSASGVQHALRSLFWPIEVLLMPVEPLASMILISATPRSQRLGDLVAGTCVLREAQRLAGAEPFQRETWSTLPKRILDLTPALGARLDAEDFRFLRGVLSRGDLERKVRQKLQRHAARHYLNVLELTDAEGAEKAEPRVLLREIYLFLREQRGTTVQVPGRAAAAARESSPAGAGPPR